MSDSHTAPHDGPESLKYPVKHRCDGLEAKTAMMAPSCSARQIESPVMDSASATFDLLPRKLKRSVQLVRIKVRQV